MITWKTDKCSQRYYHGLVFSKPIYRYLDMKFKFTKICWWETVEFSFIHQMICSRLCGHKEGMGGVHLKKVQSKKSFLNSLFFPPWVLHSILHISFLVRSRYDRECTLTQLAWRQWTRCCPFLSAVGIKPRTLPCIDLQCSLCLGIVRFDKLFASPPALSVKLS